jgi:hypothetical protein
MTYLRRTHELNFNWRKTTVLTELKTETVQRFLGAEQAKRNGLSAGPRIWTGNMEWNQCARRFDLFGNGTDFRWSIKYVIWTLLKTTLLLTEENFRLSFATDTAARRLIVLARVWHDQEDRERLERGDCSPEGCRKRRGGSGTDGDKATATDTGKKTRQPVRLRAELGGSYTVK